MAQVKAPGGGHTRRRVKRPSKAETRMIAQIAPEDPDPDTRSATVGPSPEALAEFTKMSARVQQRLVVNRVATPTDLPAEVVRSPSLQVLQETARALHADATMRDTLARREKGDSVIVIEQDRARAVARSEFDRDTATAFDAAYVSRALFWALYRADANGRELLSKWARDAVRYTKCDLQPGGHPLGPSELRPRAGVDRSEAGAALVKHAVSVAHIDNSPATVAQSMIARAIYLFPHLDDVLLSEALTEMNRRRAGHPPQSVQDAEAKAEARLAERFSSLRGAAMVAESDTVDAKRLAVATLRELGMTKDEAWATVNGSQRAMKYRAGRSKPV